MDAPPHSIIWTVDRWAPGIWDAFFQAIWWAYRRDPFTVTSWWRSVASNNLAGGHPDSQHLCGTAIDATEGAGPALRAAGFIVLEYPHHVHAQAWPAGTARRAGLLDAIGV
jgi:hypothetical protein